MCVTLSSNIEDDNKKFYRKPGSKSGQGGDVRHKSHHLSNKYYTSKIRQIKEDMQLDDNLLKVVMSYSQVLMDIECDKIKPLPPHLIINTSAT